MIIHSNKNLLAVKCLIASIATVWTYLGPNSTEFVVFEVHETLNSHDS